MRTGRKRGQAGSRVQVSLTALVTQLPELTPALAVVPGTGLMPRRGRSTLPYVHYMGIGHKECLKWATPKQTGLGALNEHCSPDLSWTPGADEALGRHLSLGSKY